MGKTGKVWLVGAGPGSADLLTVKAGRLLDMGDCIVYDRLVGREILAMLPPDKERIDVGKSAGNHAVPQSEINQILIREAKRGKKVIRLKGGDPFLFGRGGEELEALCEAKIPYEVVPGISSSIAVPAYQGIPVTHRDYVSSVHIITGHHRAGKDGAIDYEALVRTGGTLVFLMGVGALKEIMEGLLQAGMRADMPAAVLQQGTTAGQRRVAATAATLAEEAKRQKIKPPSIIVVGEVCRLADQFSWYDKLLLSGERIVVTRPSERGFKLQEQLRALGAEVLSVPVIRTVPVRDSVRLAAIEKELKRLRDYEVLAFTSVYGVERFFEILLEAGMDVRHVSHMRFAAIGQGTCDALRERGIRADYMPKQYDGASLGRLLAGELEDGTGILLARSSIGGAEILEELEKNPGLTYTDLAVYDTIFPEGQEQYLRSYLEEGGVTRVVFTSSSTVEGFTRMMGAFPYDRVKAVCIGRKTAQTAEKAGMQTVTARNAAIEEITACICRTVRG
ncbi:MAG: uroporphyrinogen-III C-methyltransferase [Lachnospiraceae bacterium]